jgi:hypothetical protein
MSRGLNADETKLNYANNTKTSLKTTIPSFIVSQFQLDNGDIIKWAISTDEKGEFLKVRPIYRSKVDGMDK